MGQASVSLTGILVVLNEPRQGDVLVGGPGYALRVFRAPSSSPSEEEFVLYSLKFAPGLAKPGFDFVTGDLLQVTVDAGRSGPLPAPVPDGAGAGAGPSGPAPAGVLYVTGWAPAPYAVPKGWPEGAASPASPYYSGRQPLALRAVVWVVTEACGVAARGGLGAQGVSELLFGPAPGAGLRAPRNATGRPSPSSAPPPPPPPPPPPTTLERFWDDCSYGAVRMKRSESLVLELSLPCGGVRANGAAWDLAAAAGLAAAGADGGGGGGGGAGCGANELWGMMEYAVNYTRQELHTDVSPLLRRVLLLPAQLPRPTGGGGAGDGGKGGGGGGPLCRGWQQRGTFGCDGVRGCDVWIQADRPDALLGALAAQLGATMGLRTAEEAAGAESPAAATATASASAPASAGSRRPTDPACPMGSAHGGSRCFNAPNAFKLGFATPLARLGGESVRPAAHLQYNLPAAATAAANMLLIEPDWTPGSGAAAAAAAQPPAAAAAAPPPLLFAQYRVAVGGDAGLGAALRRGVLTLHGLNATMRVAAAGPRTPTLPSRLLAVLAPGESCKYEEAKLVVSFQRLLPPPPESDPGGVSGGAAEVDLCRFLAATEAAAEDGCFNGLDDDCDGLVDFEDPDCAAAGEL